MVTKIVTVTPAKQGGPVRATELGIAQHSAIATQLDAFDKEKNTFLRDSPQFSQLEGHSSLEITQG